MLPPCVAETATAHDPVLVRYLLTRTLLDWELEERSMEKDKGAVHVLAVPSSSVVGTLSLLNLEFC